MDMKYRLIKFRGYSDKKECWVFGYYAVTYLTETDEHNNIVGRSAHHQIFNSLSLDGYWTEVDEASVGQFTGLYDAFGDEIYEGDLLDYRYSDDPMEVYFNEKTGSYRMKFHSDEYCINTEDVLVLGNVYNRDRHEKGMQ